MERMPQRSPTREHLSYGFSGGLPGAIIQLYLWVFYLLSFPSRVYLRKGFGERALSIWRILATTLILYMISRENFALQCFTAGFVALCIRHFLVILQRKWRGNDDVHSDYGGDSLNIVADIVANPLLRQMVVEPLIVLYVSMFWSKDEGLTMFLALSAWAFFFTEYASYRYYKKQKRRIRDGVIEGRGLAPCADQATRQEIEPPTVSEIH